MSPIELFIITTSCSNSYQQFSKLQSLKGPEVKTSVSQSSACTHISPDTNISQSSSSNEQIMRSRHYPVMEKLSFRFSKNLHARQYVYILWSLAKAALTYYQDKENTYVIPKIQETEELPAELNDMLSSLLTSDASSKEGSKPLKRRKNKSTTAQTPAATTSSFELEYVYDIYYRDKAVYETWEKERIGYM